LNADGIVGMERCSYNGAIDHGDGHDPQMIAPIHDGQRLRRIITGERGEGHVRVSSQPCLSRKRDLSISFLGTLRDSHFFRNVFAVSFLAPTKVGERVAKS
jgi:hypothetical protein